MKIEFPGLVFICMAVTCVAQKDLTRYYIEQSAVCGGIDSVLQRKGSWKKIEDDLAFADKTFPRDQYKMVNARMDAMLDLFKEAAPRLNGLEPRWYRSIRGNPYLANGAVPYTLTASYLNYYCNTNYKKIMLGDETGTWAYVFVNHLNWFCHEVDSWDINGNGKKITLYRLPEKAGEWNGMTVYQPATHGAMSRAVVLGHDGKVPWIVLSQKQYLTGLKNLIEAKKKQALDHQDARGRESSEKFFNEKLKPIDDYLATHTDETLHQPAILDPKGGIEGFEGQFGSEEKGGIKLIAVTARYFNKNLPRHAAQFMVLYWRWTEHPASLHFKEQFEENFPLEKLKAMIDH